MALLKITCLGEEDGTGIGPKVKPTQPQKQSPVSRFLPLFVCFFASFFTSHESEPPRTHVVATETDLQTEAGICRRDLLPNIL